MLEQNDWWNGRCVGISLRFSGTIAVKLCTVSISNALFQLLIDCYRLCSCLFICAINVFCQHILNPPQFDNKVCTGFGHKKCTHTDTKWPNRKNTDINCTSKDRYHRKPVRHLLFRVSVIFGLVQTMFLVIWCCILFDTSCLYREWTLSKTLIGVMLIMALQAFIKKTWQLDTLFKKLIQGQPQRLRTFSW